MVQIQPVSVRTSLGVEKGNIVYVDESLVAVVVHLEDDLYEDMRGGWYIEACLIPLAPDPPIFSTAEEAANWIDKLVQQNVARRSRRGDPAPEASPTAS